MCRVSAITRSCPIAANCRMCLVEVEKAPKPPRPTRRGPLCPPRPTPSQTTFMTTVKSLPALRALAAASAALLLAAAGRLPPTRKTSPAGARFRQGATEVLDRPRYRPPRLPDHERARLGQLLFQLQRLHAGREGDDLHHLRRQPDGPEARRPSRPGRWRRASPGRSSSATRRPRSTSRSRTRTRSTCRSGRPTSTPARSGRSPTCRAARAS